MRLSDLFPDADLHGDPMITHLAEDSRRTGPGALFFAHIRSKQNGTDFINAAIMAGCVAIVVPKDAAIGSLSVPVIRVDHTRVEIARCASLFYQGQPNMIVAVTGTSGKTSTTYFAQQIFNTLNHRAVSLGTIGVAGAMTKAESLTTPEAPELHATLQDVARAGITHVMMEASSQGLHQHRLDFVRLQAAALTNLSRDHLDYHGTMENYRDAKAALFTRVLPPTGTAILNADDPAFDYFHAACTMRGQRVITYGRAGRDLALRAQELTPAGQRLTIVYNDKETTFDLAVAGAFQGYNVLAAIGLALACGCAFSDIMRAVPHITAPPGRLQRVDGHPGGACVYVDYAHKPAALENVLQSLQAHHPNKLICVFGCGGDRDTGKRPLMGEIAARLATHVIITDDNPRSEDPAAIRAAILSACPGAQNIGDRRQAMTTALHMAGPGDIVVVAGKGHEQGQKFADHTDPFDDVIVCQDIIAALVSTPSSPATLTRKTS